MGPECLNYHESSGLCIIAQQRSARSAQQHRSEGAEINIYIYIYKYIYNNEINQK